MQIGESDVTYEVRWDVSTDYRTKTRRKEFGNMVDAQEFAAAHKRRDDMTIFKVTVERIG